MKRVLLLTSVLLVLAVSVALASGVSLNWGSVCYTEAPKYLQTFACNTNTGSWVMTSSFKIDTEMTDMVSVEITMEGEADATALPDWWKLGASPDCRARKAQFSSDFSTTPQVSCFDWTNGQGLNAFGYTWDACRAHITAAVAIDVEHPFDMQPGVEYYAGAVTILNSKTVGAGACSGCDVFMLWTAPLITVGGLGGRRDDLTWTMFDACPWLAWHRIPCDGPGCHFGCDPTPTRNTTWGQVKSMYR